ncbi:hypothetical protein C8Q73DRAFT_794584 [Cubamyces lactineus]|nr:hypothetical protein C8Q73DRAFT_794584 [Cubamyces lactineus]
MCPGGLELTPELTFELPSTTSHSPMDTALSESRVVQQVDPTADDNFQDELPRLDDMATPFENLTVTPSDQADALSTSSNESAAHSDSLFHHSRILSHRRGSFSASLDSTAASNDASPVSVHIGFDISPDGTPTSDSYDADHDMKILDTIASYSRPAPPPFPPTDDVVQEQEPNGLMEAGFLRTFTEVRRQQDRLQGVIDRLEQELCSVQDRVSESLQRSVGLIRRTRELIAKERQAMEKQHALAADNISVLENRLRQAQRHIATLEAQHLTQNGLIEHMAQEISALWLHQEAIGGRLEHAEMCEEHVRVMANRLDEYMHDMTMREMGLSQSQPTPKLTLADELINDAGSVDPCEREKAIPMAQAANALNDNRSSLSMIGIIGGKLAVLPRLLRPVRPDTTIARSPATRPQLPTTTIAYSPTCHPHSPATSTVEVPILAERRCRKASAFCALILILFIGAAAHISIMVSRTGSPLLFPESPTPLPDAPELLPDALKPLPDILEPLPDAPVSFPDAPVWMAYGA